MHVKRLAGLVAAPLLGAALAAPAAASAATTSEDAAPPPTVHTYAGTWNRTWRNGKVRTDTPDPIQGTASGGKNVAQVGFPAALMQADLAAEIAAHPTAHISQVEVWLYGRHWWGATGSADIGVHASAAKPATFKYSGSLTVPNWARYTGKWVTLPSAWLPGWNSGNTKGITLGGKAQASTSPVFYGRFNDVYNALAWSRPLIRTTISTS